MDLDIIQSTREGEITQFLCDVRDYFKASLATSEYENTSNMFYLTSSETTERLLKRCECLLSRLKSKNEILLRNTKLEKEIILPQNNHQQLHRFRNQYSVGVHANQVEIDNEDVSYLDMTASSSSETPNAKETMNFKNYGDNKKTFRCSTLVLKHNTSFLHRLHESAIKTVDGEDKFKNFEEDAQIYDICQVTTNGSDGEEDELGLAETQKAIHQISHFSLPNIDCPYVDLPAGHLPIQKSTKYGQLQKIEKRLFFDQNRKCYCGVLNNWLLCYADGPTSSRPTISLYLKIPGIEVEHFGEGKRRDISFQITTSDPIKRFVFQAINEIDAKEWIHAIETALRNDNSSTRKLPTPPVVKKIPFSNHSQGGMQSISNITPTDYIYEEPSAVHEVLANSTSEDRPELPNKKKNLLELANKFEYDFPKCPPKPFKDTMGSATLLVNPYDKNNSMEKMHSINLSDSLHLASSSISEQKLNLKMEENSDFKAKVRDVHIKLTSHLSNGANIKNSLIKTPSTTSKAVTESSSLHLTASAITEAEKQKKTSHPSNSPQKINNAKNWFLNRLNKTTSSTRSNSSSPSNSPSKSKQSEKETLLNSSSDVYDSFDMNISNLGKDLIAPVLKSSSPSIGTSKVNMIINQLEASGHLASMFNVDAVASFSSHCENDSNNYEPIMNPSTMPTNLIKKV